MQILTGKSSSFTDLLKIIMTKEVVPKPEKPYYVGILASTNPPNIGIISYNEDYYKTVEELHEKNLAGFPRNWSISSPV